MKRKSRLQWRDVGRWWDTEGSGNIGVNRYHGKIKGRVARVNISQKEYEPLRIIGDFLTERNIFSRIYSLGGQVYSLQVFRQEDVYRFLRYVEPYVMTRNHKDTIRTLREFLNRPSRVKWKRRQTALRAIAL